jgi:hypothetical protein
VHDVVFALCARLIMGQPVRARSSAGQVYYATADTLFLEPHGTVVRRGDAFDIAQELVRRVGTSPLRKIAA